MIEGWEEARARMARQEFQDAGGWEDCTSYTHVVRPELDPDQSTQAQIGRLLDAGLINPPDVPVVVMPDGTLMRAVEYWPADPGVKS